MTISKKIMRTFEHGCKGISQEWLLSLTRNIPMRQIDSNGSPYLQRYHYYTDDEDGSQIWIHRFLSCDGDEHLHTHPLYARTLILSGGYVEQVGRFNKLTGIPMTWELMRSPGDTYEIEPDYIHRISHVLPETWTVMHVQAGRLPTWNFINADGSRVEMQSSPEDWYLSYGPRTE